MTRCVVGLAWSLLFCAAVAQGQRIQFTDPYSDPPLVPVVQVAQGPGATFNGGIQPMPGFGGFDPYAHQTMQPPALLPQPGLGGNPQSAYYGSQPFSAYPNSTYTTGPQASSPSGSYLFVQPNGQVAYLPRLLQAMRFRYTWIKGRGSDDVEWNSAEVEGTFLFPFFHLPAPLLITPGGAIHFVNGPGPGSPADLPPRLYDLFLDVGWRPHITQWLSADLGARVGVYTDFNAFGSDALRVQARALGAFNYSPTVEVKAGVVYLDRVRTKLLPAGGIIWTPHENARWEILFPNPKLAWRFTQYGTADIWLYVAGEYGGGSWYIERDSGDEDRVDYNDIKLILGLEWSTPRGLKGMFEVGYVWDREIKYKTTPGDVSLGDTFMLRGGIQF